MASPNLRRIVAAACLIAAFGGASVASAAETVREYEFCGEPLSANAFGRPLDYNDPANREHIAGIEHNHLSRDVELLVRGVTSDSPVDDLAYVLRQVPNHHKALAVMSNFQLKNGYRGDYAANLIYTADCYFRRALSFKNDDAVAHMIYGIHLHRSDKHEDALAEYEIAQKLGLVSAELHYNLGLLYVDMKRYDAAREQAKKAYELGYPLGGLRSRLARLGEWR